MNTVILYRKKSAGESLVELVLAMGILAVILPTLIYGIGGLNTTEPARKLTYNSSVFSEEAMTIIQQMANENWTHVSTNGSYILDRSGNVWALRTVASYGPTPLPTMVDRWVRTIDIANAMRDGSGALSESGTIIEPAMKKITVTTRDGLVGQQLQTTFYISRHNNIQTTLVSTQADFTQSGYIANGSTISSPSAGDDGSITVINSAPQKPATLVSRWNMDVYTTNPPSAVTWVSDIAGGGNDALVYPLFAAPPALVDSRYGKGIPVNITSVPTPTQAPAQHLRIAYSPNLALGRSGSGMTWEYVIKPATNNPTTIIQWWSTGANPTPTHGAHASLYQSGTDVLSVLDPTSPNRRLSTAVSPLSSGAYHHIMMVYDAVGRSIRHYVDGVVQNMTSTPTPIPGGPFDADTNHPLAFGFVPPGGYFTGVIDDVALYSSALTESQVEQATYSTYTSPVRDFGVNHQAQILSFIAEVNQPTGTKIYLRIASRDADVTGYCPADEPSYTFVGPAGTSGLADYFSVQGVNISGTPPLSGMAGYVNPGRCMRYKIYFMSMNEFPTGPHPVLKSFKYVYSL